MDTIPPGSEAQWGVDPLNEMTQDDFALSWRPALEND